MPLHPTRFTSTTGRAAASQRWYRHATVRLVTLAPCAACGGTVHGWQGVDGAVVPVPPARCAGCGKTGGNDSEKHSPQMS